MSLPFMRWRCSPSCPAIASCVCRRRKWSCCSPPCRRSRSSRPPPPPPRSLPHDSTPLPPVPKLAAPPLRDIDVVPHTEVAATIVDDTMPVEAARGKLDGTGTAGPGDVGEGTGSGRAAVRARASVISWRRRSTAYPYDRGSCSGSGGRMIDTLRVLQHDIQRKRQLARAGVFVFTAWRNVPDRGLRACLRTPPPAIHRARP